MAITLALPKLQEVAAPTEVIETKKRGGKETARVTYQEFSRGLNAFAMINNREAGREVNLRSGDTWEKLNQAWEDVSNAPNVITRESEHGPIICLFVIRQDEGITATCTKYPAKIQVVAGKDGEQKYDVVWSDEETEVYTPKF